MKNRGNWAIFALCGALLFIAHWAGFWVMLGGHPFWSLSATQIGLGGGLLLGIILMVLQKPNLTTLLILVAIAVIAFGISTYGKQEFVGSYAEDRTAGKIWYFGFIAFIIALFNVASLALRRLRFQP